MVVYTKEKRSEITRYVWATESSSNNTGGSKRSDWIFGKRQEPDHSRPGMAS